MFLLDLMIQELAEMLKKIGLAFALSLLKQDKTTYDDTITVNDLIAQRTTDFHFTLVAGCMLCRYRFDLP
jgi:hypothetical protein